MGVHALRGATQLDIDDRDHLLERVAELVRELMTRNGLTPEDLISIVFTATSDIRSEFPAYAARAIGITDVPLLCAQELEVVGAMPRVVRLLAHAETDVPRTLLRHVYLHGALELRTDLPR